MHNSKSYKFTVQYDSNLRIDKYIASKLTDISRTKIKKTILDGKLTLNNTVFYDCSHILNVGDVITIDILSLTENYLEPYDFKINIVFEDQYLLVLDKPPFLTVHPGAGNRNKTLVNALINSHKNLSQIGGSYRPGIVHRLDKDTSGLMIVAKDDITHAKLAALIAKRQIQRKYHALIYGCPFPKFGKIEENIDRCRMNRTKMRVVKNSGRPSLTYYKVIQELGPISLIECELATGRTHQIRVHMSYKGYPIVGDKTYGTNMNYNLNACTEKVKNLISSLPRQALHATKLEFIHPMNHKMLHFESTVPDDIQVIIDSITFKFA